MIRQVLFRQAQPASTRHNLAKTFAQIVVFWGTFLWLLPELVVRVENALEFPKLPEGPLPLVGMVLFAVCSALGLSSAYSMSAGGRGTPLPMDSPQRLVVSGLYSYVRNPMAMSAFGQGVAVGLWRGSPLVIVYVTVGITTWQLFVRPLEEQDLAVRFGDEYERYKREVRCWIPRLSRYKPYADPT